MANEYVDVAGANKRAKEREADEGIIEAIVAALKGQEQAQSAVCDAVRASDGIGRKSVERVLKRYSQYSGNPDWIWFREKGFQKNAWRIWMPAKTDHVGF